jgi:DNA (cytosine-5)-methyltransferase 1
MFPTPRKTDAERGGRGDLLASIRGYPTQRAHWPTPKASASGPDYARASRPGAGGDDLATAVALEERGGQLNPEWVEWLMGWPAGWTDLEHLSDDAFAAWRKVAERWRAEPRDIPRVARDVPRRVDRLKALGNGQVPACVALAWRLLGRTV